MIGPGRAAKPKPLHRVRKAASRAPDGRPFLAAIENAVLGRELQGLLDGLLGPAELEWLAEDGSLVLQRLRSAHPRLVFLPMQMRRMEALTLLRALPPARARQIVLIAPDTMEGQRVAWEALCLGARDVLPTKGDPAHRFKGSIGQRLRQLACMLAGDRESDGEAALPFDEQHRPVAGASAPADAGWREDPWVVLPETRSLARVAGWLSTLPPDVPVVVRIPEGPRLLRAAREGLGRLTQWSVRTVASGDRLVPGQIHLFGEAEAVRLEGSGGPLSIQVRALNDPPGSWAAYHGLLRDLRDSTVGLRVLAPDAEDPDLAAFLSAGGRSHAVYHLERVSAERPRRPAERVPA